MWQPREAPASATLTEVDTTGTDCSHVHVDLAWVAELWRHLLILCDVEGFEFGGFSL